VRPSHAVLATVAKTIPAVAVVSIKSESACACVWRPLDLPMREATQVASSAALSGSHHKAPGFGGRYPELLSFDKIGSL
jgi:hypothetical protein